MKKINGKERDIVRSIIGKTMHRKPPIKNLRIINFGWLYKLLKPEEIKFIKSFFC